MSAGIAHSALPHTLYGHFHSLQILQETLSIPWKSVNRQPLSARLHRAAGLPVLQRYPTTELKAAKSFFFMWHWERCLHKIWHRKPFPLTRYISLYFPFCFKCAALLHVGLSGAVSSGQLWYKRKGWEATENKRLTENTWCFWAIYCSSGWLSFQEKE